MSYGRQRGDWEPKRFFLMGYVYGLHECGWTYKQIGEKIGLTGSRASQIGKRGEKMARAHLKKDGGL